MSIRNYNAFLKAVKKEHGLTHKQAQASYRRTAARLGRPAKGIDVTRHPRIVKESTSRTSKRGGTGARGSRISLDKASKRGAGEPRKSQKQRRPRTIEEWIDTYDRATDFEDERVVSSADYGKGKRGK